MSESNSEPPIADAAPTDPILTGYDEQHRITYIRLLDADADQADWREVARIVLKIDPDKDADRAYRAWQTHLNRARWMTREGYKFLLRGGAPN